MTVWIWLRSNLKIVLLNSPDQNHAFNTVVEKTAVSSLNAIRLSL